MRARRRSGTLSLRSGTLSGFPLRSGREGRPRSSCSCWNGILTYGNVPREAPEAGLVFAGGAPKLIVLPGNGGALLASTAARVNGASPLPLTSLCHRPVKRKLDLPCGIMDG